MKLLQKIVPLAGLLSLSLLACSPTDPNPPAPGFNKADSDLKAVSIADDVMQAMGGRRAALYLLEFLWPPNRIMGQTSRILSHRMA